MRIAMFGHKRIPSREGGVEIVVEALSTRMAALGHEVICYNRGGQKAAGVASYQGVRLKTVPTWQRKGLAAVSASFFSALFAAFSRAQVVHIHAEGPGLMCWLPKLLGKRVIVTVHGLDWQREKWQGSFGAAYIRMGEAMTARFADEVIVLSRNMQDYFRRTYGRETIWIPNGIDKPERLPPERIRERFGLEKDAYFLFLGRLVPEKRIHDLIGAFRQVDTDKRLVIAGAASDTEDYAASLKELARGDERILFTGFVQGKLLEELYSNAYVYVLPSRVEGMSMSLLEAMSYGTCCVISDIPECVEVAQERAVIFPAGDQEGLRNCLQQLCAEPETVAAYRDQTRQYVCDRYRWEDVVDKTLRVYQ